MSDDFRGKTALITGASSGIGEAFARALAARGMDLILVARRADVLQQLADALAREHGVRVTVLPADLGVAGAAQRLLAECQAQQRVVDLLVNNAGFGTYGPFEQIPAERDREMIQVNVAAVCDLAHAFIPPMLARGEGAVINVASSAGFQPAPYFATYAASKAFVLSFSEALWGEYRRRGIRVVAVCPGPVATAFFEATQSNIGDVKFFANTITAERVVREGLRALEKNRPSVVNGWLNWLQTLSVRFGPRALVVLISERLMRASR